MSARRKQPRPASVRDLVLVEWEDAAKSHNYADSLAEAAAEYEPYITRSVGWLARHDKRATILVNHTEDADGRSRDRMVLPRGMVRRIEVLRRGR